MPVKTKEVSGRRELHFNSMDDILADVEKLASSEVQCLGNWSLAQILDHLTKTVNISIDGTTFRPAWYLRLLIPLMKKSFLTKTMRAGFKMPEGMKKDFMPKDDITTEEAIAAFRTAIERLKNDPKRSPHVVLGNLTDEEWVMLHCRHSEMHLSFAVPVNPE